MLSSTRVQFILSDRDVFRIYSPITAVEISGVLLTSSYEYPGRYSRWTVGFTAPALQIEGAGNHVFLPSLLLSLHFHLL